MSVRRRAISGRRFAVLEVVRRTGLPVERLPDEALLAGLATGDPEIGLAFVRRFQRRVFGVAVTILGDPRLAEDVVQQTFERAWRHAQVYDSRRGSVRTWLVTIAHNLAIDAVRVRRPLPLDPGDLLELADDISAGPEQQSVAHEDAAELRAAIATLPPPQARALMMAGIHGMTAQQIADAEGIPLGTAKTRIRAAMGKLRGVLAQSRADHE